MSDNGKILIIGNGFDLAHGLPTRYSDFLEFGQRFLAVYSFLGDDAADFEEKQFSNWKGNEKIKERLIDLFKEKQRLDANPYNPKYSLGDEFDGLRRLLLGNIWFDYFCDLYRDNTIKGINWIDFESEISDIIQWIDGNNEGMDSAFFAFHQQMMHAGGKLVQFYQKSDIQGRGKPATVEDFVIILYDHLKNLIKALNMYLCLFVEPLIDTASKKDVIERIRPSQVISFNYTHTYSRLYDSNADVCYIHGECGEGIDNMVLGIDEYQDGHERDSHNDMAIFKKFVQRVRNKNDIRYRDWAGKRKEIFNREANKIYYGVYVYGHSLDVTDRDVLELFLKPDFSSVHVFAYDEVDEGRKYPNLIRIIGEDKLIEKATANPKRFETIIDDGGL